MKRLATFAAAAVLMAGAAVANAAGPAEELTSYAMARSLDAQPYSIGRYARASSLASRTTSPDIDA